MEKILKSGYSNLWYYFMGKANMARPMDGLGTEQMAQYSQHRRHSSKMRLLISKKF